MTKIIKETMANLFKVFGFTTFDNNHAHEFQLNGDRFGATSVDNGHFHMIVDGEVQEADGHTHRIGEV